MPSDLFSLSFSNRSQTALPEWQRQVKAKLLELVNFELAPPVDSFNVTSTEVLMEADGIRQVRHMVKPGPWPPQPLYEITPLQGQPNGVTLITFHGHGKGLSDPIYCYINELARLGYRVVMPILYGKMERDTHKMTPYDPRAACASWSLEADALGMHILGIRLFDAMLAFAFARSLPGVKEDRIGCVGLSMGGELSLYLAALEPRIKFCVSAGFFSSYQSLLIDQRNCQCYSIRGWRRYFDMPDLAGCIAPRPLQIQKGLDDPCLNAADAESAFEKVKAVYAHCGQSVRAEYRTYPGKHILNVDIADAWIKQHAQ